MLYKQCYNYIDITEATLHLPRFSFFHMYRRLDKGLEIYKKVRSVADPLKKNMQQKSSKRQDQFSYRV